MTIYELDPEAMPRASHVRLRLDHHGARGSARDARHARQRRARARARGRRRAAASALRYDGGRAGCARSAFVGSPGDHGGNIDNWRIGAGARMLYPVQVAGALLSVGDPHVSQGDGEVSGTALEASLNGMLRLTRATRPRAEHAGARDRHGATGAWVRRHLDEAMLAARSADARAARHPVRAHPRRRLCVLERRRRLHRHPGGRRPPGRARPHRQALVPVLRAGSSR